VLLDIEDMGRVREVVVNPDTEGVEILKGSFLLFTEEIEDGALKAVSSFAELALD
jgi:hypothetical protein